MEGIEEILAEAGIEGDAAAKAKGKILANYRSIAELDNAKAKIEELSSQVGQLTGTAEEVEKLRKTVADYKAAEEKRAADEAEAQAKAGFEQSFNEAVGDHEFAGKFAHDAALEKSYAIHKANPDMATADILKAVIGDGEGVWKSPNAQIKPVPQPNSQESVDAQKAAIAAALFSPNA